MFTGIITDIGKVDRIKPLNEGVLLRIETVYDPETIELGASIACSGVCLTVVALPEKGTNARWFEVEAWEEALRLTTISTWENGTNINLERSLKLGDEMGGHLVSGHVDGQAEIVARKDEGDAVRFTLRASYAAGSECANEGTITSTFPDGTEGIVDGVYLYRVDEAGKLVSVRAFWEFEKLRIVAPGG